MSYNGGEEWEVSSREWSIKNSLRYPTRCHGLFGLLLPLLLFIEPQPLGFVGEEVVFCICAALPPPPTLVFFPKGRQPRLQSLQAVCLSWAGCCVSTLGSSVIRKPPASLPACSVWMCVLQKRGTGLCHCSLGHCPGPVCLCVYLSALVCQLVYLSFCVTLLPQCGGPHGVCPVAGSQNDTGLGLMAETSSHTLIISVNMLCWGTAESYAVLVRAAAKVPGWCP